MRVWQRHLRPRDLFVDVGANIGLYTLWALEQGAHAISLEPDVDACARLREHLELNNGTADVLQAAAGAAPGRVAMTSDRDSANHLLLDVAGDVEMVTIDDLVGAATVAGMKVDVEGAERLVLDGVARALKDRRIRLLQTEWNGLSEVMLGESRQPIAEMLSGCGYQLAYPTRAGELRPVIDPPSRPGVPDVFALPV
jgi:FkbM family methyltransferase